MSQHAGSHELSTVLVLAGVLGAGLVAGCGGDDEGGSSSRPTATLRIEVTDSGGRFRYSAPRSVPAGLVRITLRNSGSEPHKAQLMRINGRHSIATAIRARRPWPRWLFAAGGVGVVRPGATGSSVQQLFPGTYYVTGSGNERGRVAPLRVTGNQQDVELPEADATVTADDYTFAASGLRAGRTRIEFNNVGAQPHHIVFAPLKPGATAADYRRFVRGGTRGSPPVEIDRALTSAVLEGTGRQVAEVDLKAGRYALLCFVPDRDGGPPHVVKGMVAEARIP